jgi:hypothetical protein
MEDKRVFARFNEVCCHLKFTCKIKIESGGVNDE